MLKSLFKDPQVSGNAGIWGIFNNMNGRTCSPEGYLLIIEQQKIARLDDLTPQNEKVFWDFMFSNAARGIKDASKRSSKNISDDECQPSAISCSAICAVNDGIAAWQTVGTTHGHIVWVADQKNIGDIQVRLDSDRAFFSGFPGAYQPLVSTDVVLTPDHYSDDIRAARQSLREKFNVFSKPDELSFSIYTKNAFATDPRFAEGKMVVEAWSKKHHAIASLSQFVRYWNNLIPTPINPQPLGLQYADFIPKS